ncbi:hypothetical protein SAMN05216374_4547 [Tardiphaga sp. OK246]|uniref:hypothetical protein n=1 Tax=Tardiphaga sp. OK246 TaxID=1855307 RepID=UPI000B6B07C7|nr:hypothetical protein [Tardiphaga sp. OK246]SNT52527.1 hypothetical protein SAMN05216374_4547 [Tardiphaga sp. OK246]
MAFNFTSDVKSKQKDCWLILNFSGEEISLSFDDAIELKIQINHVLETGTPNERKIVSEADSWSALCVPNAGGFGVAFVLSATSTIKLWLDAGQAERFSAELQTFIDLVGSRS